MLSRIQKVHHTMGDFILIFEGGRWTAHGVKSVMSKIEQAVTAKDATAVLIDLEKNTFLQLYHVRGKAIVYEVEIVNAPYGSWAYDKGFVGKTFKAFISDHHSEDRNIWLGIEPNHGWLNLECGIPVKPLGKIEDVMGNNAEMIPDIRINSMRSEGGFGDRIAQKMKVEIDVTNSPEILKALSKWDWVLVTKLIYLRDDCPFELSYIVKMIINCAVLCLFDNGRQPNQADILKVISNSIPAIIYCTIGD